VNLISVLDLLAAPVCPDPAGHARLYAQAERTWRLSAAQRRGEAEIGCPWCALPSGHVR